MAALVIVASLALADKLEKKKQARKDKKAALHDDRVRDLRAEMSESKSGTATTAGTVTGGPAIATTATGAVGKRRDSVREWWESDDEGEEVGSGAQAQQRSAREEQVRAPPPPLEYEKKAAGGAGGKRTRLLRAW
ncbi:hypothetical protein LTR12_006212 [Friedmanniomyces endolithicus]|nr:hypothetical protein LTR12_006212 [Friedmanniomyces endolithicus]